MRDRTPYANRWWIFTFVVARRLLARDHMTKSLAIIFEWIRASKPPFLWTDAVDRILHDSNSRMIQLLYKLQTFYCHGNGWYDSINDEAITIGGKGTFFWHDFLPRSRTMFSPFRSREHIAFVYSFFFFLYFFFSFNSRFKCRVSSIGSEAIHLISKQMSKMRGIGFPP